ncbi:MAG: MFS transporter [Gammaproteobacteria bacterium]|nr:MFS transporter [Gammaproteobacteria bacterium]
MSRSRILAVVLYGHFTAAAAALGLPAFYGRVLADLGEVRPGLVGLFFVIPTLGAALANPFWGRIADRIGKRPALARAHLGLAASFFAASLADSVAGFALALALQGLFGGSFAASNAYLATLWSGHSLSRILTVMQGSARLALFAGPALVGWGLGLAEPLRLYRGLALLPLIAAWLVLRLPADRAVGSNEPAGTQPRLPPILAPWAIYALHYAFVFATVLGFPLFVGFAESRLPGLPAALLGLLYGLPHGVYLLAAAPLARGLTGRESGGWLAAALALTAVGLAGQAWAGSLAALVAWRVLLGLGMSACYVLVHGLIARVTEAGNAGRRFGGLEACTKWGAVSAGLGAAALGQYASPVHCFYLGAALLLLPALLLIGNARQLRRPPRMTPTPIPPWSDR